MLHEPLTFQPITLSPDDLLFVETRRMIDDQIIGTFRLTEALLKAGELPMQSTLAIGGVALAVKDFTLSTDGCPMPWAGRERYTIGPAECSGEFAVTVQWNPGAWIEALCLAHYGVTLDDLIAALECRRWLLAGGPLGAWYRGRPGWRLADAVSVARN